MNKLFDLNNPLMRGLTAITNLLILSCAWLVLCIPVITIGPATAALYYVAQKMIAGENPSILKSFWKSFRENLKQGIVLTVIFGIAAALMYYDYLFSYMVEESLGKVLQIFFAVMAGVWLLFVCYVFPLQAQFQNPIGQTFKNALLLALIHPVKTLQLMGLHLIPVVVCLVFPEIFARTLPIWLVFAPGVVAYLCTLRMKKIWTSLRGQAQTEQALPEG